MAAACAGGGGNQNASTSPAAATSPSANLAARCRIPLSWMGTDALPKEGFMDLTTGQVTDMPAAHLEVAGGNLARSPGPPALIGWPTGSSYYDAPLGRWLPALGQWISPEGGVYMYLNFAASELHVVDVATGNDRVLAGGKRLYPLAWLTDHVYVMDFPTGSPVQTYSISVPGGQLTTLTAKLSSVVPVGGGGAWITEVSSNVPHATGSNGPVANSVSRIDLVSGQKVEWFSAANATVVLLGFTQSGTPLIESTSSSGILLSRLSGPGNTIENFTLKQAAVGSATDAHGTWLLDGNGEVLIYNEGASPKVLASAPTGLGGFGLAGGCAPR
jgi:hypothetical protein